MNNKRGRKSIVKHIHGVTSENGIIDSLYGATSLPSSLDMFALHLARRKLRDKYNLRSFAQLVILTSFEAIENRIGFFWRDLVWEIDQPSRVFAPLLKTGYFERIPFPLSFTHILTMHNKVYKLSPLGREVLDYFRSEYKKALLKHKQGRKRLAEQLK